MCTRKLVIPTNIDDLCDITLLKTCVKTKNLRWPVGLVQIV